MLEQSHANALDNPSRCFLQMFFRRSSALQTLSTSSVLPTTTSTSSKVCTDSTTHHVTNLWGRQGRAAQSTPCSTAWRSFRVTRLTIGGSWSESVKVKVVASSTLSWRTCSRVQRMRSTCELRFTACQVSSLLTVYTLI